MAAIASYFEGGFWDKIKTHREIDFAGAEITDFVLHKLASIFPHLANIEAMDFSGCQLMNDDQLHRLFSVPHPRVRRLSFSGCPNISKAEIWISQTYNVENLDLSGSSITDETLRHLSKRPRLITLDISGCTQVTDAGIEALFSFPGCMIRKLIACNCPYITGTGFTNTRKLQSLILSGRSVTDQTLQVLFTNPSQLESLDLRNCPHVTDAWSRRPLPQLRALALHGSTCAEKTLRNRTRNFPNLETLHLINCTNVSGDFIDTICTCIPKLITLVIEGCTPITASQIKDAQDLLRIKKDFKPC